jgi:hypothetical protein
LILFYKIAVCQKLNAKKRLINLILINIYYVFKYESLT